MESKTKEYRVLVSEEEIEGRFNSDFEGKEERIDFMID